MQFMLARQPPWAKLCGKPPHPLIGGWGGHCLSVTTVHTWWGQFEHHGPRHSPWRTLPRQDGMLLLQFAAYRHLKSASCVPGIGMGTGHVNILLGTVVCKLKGRRSGRAA